jgi:hypothetical protein
MNKQCRDRTVFTATRRVDMILQNTACNLSDIYLFTSTFPTNQGLETKSSGWATQL